MTLDDAIKHAEEKAKESTSCDCAAEHAQLARWLKHYRDIINGKPRFKISEGGKTFFKYGCIAVVMLSPFTFFQGAEYLARGGSIARDFALLPIFIFGCVVLTVLVGAFCEWVYTIYNHGED